MSEETKPKLKANDHENYTTYTILAVLLPLVGFILGIIFLTKDKQLDRKLGEHLLAFSILFSIVYGIGWQIFTTLQTGLY